MPSTGIRTVVPYRSVLLYGWPIFERKKIERRLGEFVCRQRLAWGVGAIVVDPIEASCRLQDPEEGPERTEPRSGADEEFGPCFRMYSSDPVLGSALRALFRDLHVAIHGRPQQNCS